MSRYTEYEHDGRWGVQDHYGAVLYEPEFSKDIANALAEMENGGDPPVDWFDAQDRLLRIGVRI